MNNQEIKKVLTLMAYYSVVSLKWIIRNWKVCLIVFFAVVTTSVLCRCGSHKTVASSVNTIPVHRVDTFYRSTLIPSVYYVEVPAKVDTAAVIHDYYTHKVYRDTVHFVPDLTTPTLAESGSIDIIMTDTVGLNSIAGRSVIVDYTPPASPRSKINAVVLGSSVSAQSQSVWAGYRHKRTTYQAGYDLFNRSIMAGVAIDLLRW